MNRDEHLLILGTGLLAEAVEASLRHAPKRTVVITRDADHYKRELDLGHIRAVPPPALPEPYMLQAMQYNPGKKRGTNLTPKKKKRRK